MNCEIRLRDRPTPAETSEPSKPKLAEPSMQASGKQIYATQTLILAVPATQQGSSLSKQQRSHTKKRALDRRSIGPYRL